MIWSVRPTLTLCTLCIQQVRRAAREKKKKARETQRKKAARDENAFSKDASLERDDALEHSFRSRVDTPTLPVRKACCGRAVGAVEWCERSFGRALAL